MGSSSAPGKKAHAVCLPAPAQGHVIPMLDVATMLHACGFDVTFVNTEYNHARLVRARGAAAVAGVPGFRFATIPDGLPASDDDVTQDVPSLCKSTEETCLGPFRRLLAELNGPATGHPPVTCVVADALMDFSMEAAKELGLPYVQLWTSSAISFVGYCHYRLLFERGLAPIKDVKQLTDEYLDTPVEDVPGLRNMRFRDFPTFICSPAPLPYDFMLHFALRITERSVGASAMMVNTFGDLEGEVVAATEALGMPKVYTIGPLPLLAPSSNISMSLWKQQECLPWLHGKARGSVVYVNFGSITVMNNEQLVEFAWGLAKSGRHFLWIIRPDLVKGDTAVLPPEFSAETAERGLVASWCPQQQVLNHPAVGAFLTHSDWNSTMESMCGGVPVISWPFFADQQTNCRYQCNEWGVGMEIDSNVQSDAVADLITEVMEGDKGQVMKKKVQEWREKAVKAAKPGGSSHRNFEELIINVLAP
ncbi:7-deoxyloganetin glucosyltransferase-like [Triticum dicoccoides]|uniref:7-deoxyloganetin glucosyltransferase-like n=1 Tax=Triticum dicoccoides TaxID=85692 RepID=UPI00188FF5F3|nr:7-deoxyloganetin glucosyltransferase-like [Triticum dicoccoides]XP_044386127.1 7-deoxyloganetin glucosyltransferase-like [Triticum aestivum]